MPNHISNRIEFKSFDDDWHREEEVFKQLETLMKTEDSPFDFNVLVPYPEPFKSMDEERRKAEQEIGLFAATIQQKDGYNSGGYEWCVKHWGTKWNAYSIGFGYEEVYFQTAWSTPFPIFEELSKRFPDMLLIVEYADEDRGSNCGRIFYSDGKELAWEDVSKRPEAVLFARAIIAEQHAADSWAELQEYKNKGSQS